jgi:HTH-type transcriptional regulator/antitoxin HigA
MRVAELLAPWETINAALGLSAPIKNEAHYTQLLAFVDEAFDQFGGNDQHPIFTLVSLAADRIRAYEAENYAWPDASTPATRLAYLMDTNRLSQKDLPTVAPQSVIPEILSGKRKINLRQAQALAERFGVPIDVFAA